MKKLVSIVIPAWNEYKNLVELRPVLENITDSLKNRYNFEFLLIDNHSDDNTQELILKYVEEDSRWKYIRFSRNFGLEASFAHGINYSKGDAVIFLFSDLQDPPELIPNFLEKWEKGYQVVYGLIQGRADGNFVERLGAYFTHKMLSRLTCRLIPENAADYQLLDRKVISAIRKYTERNRYFRGIVHSAGFKKCPVPFSRNRRRHGKSTMDIIYRVGYAITSLTAFTSNASLCGLILTVLSIIGAILYTLSKVLSTIGIEIIPSPPLGWTTLVLLLLLFNGLNMFFIGIIGRYIANIYIEVKNRPLAHIEMAIGFSNILEKS